METALPAQTILWLTFAIGFVLGGIGQRTQFCTMGALSDIVAMGDWHRMRMWLLAIGVAVLGSGALHGAGLIDLDKSIYRTPNFMWLSHIVGGLSFGAGMVLASGCAAKTLIRIGGGSLKSLLVFIVLGLVAYMTMRGVLGVFRVKTLDTVAVTLSGGQDIPALLAAAGLAPKSALLLPVLILGGGLSMACLYRRDFRTGDLWLGGLGTGLAVVAAWYVSGHLGYLAEHPETLAEAFLTTRSGHMEALSFVAPQAYTLELLMLWSDTGRQLSFGVATALGVVAGSLAGSLWTRRFRWEGFVGLEDTASHLIGAALMGFGGVLAMGCTIGQGISGISTLALGSLLTFAAIVLGAVIMLRFQYWRLMRQA